MARNNIFKVSHISPLNPNYMLAGVVISDFFWRWGSDFFFGGGWGSDFLENFLWGSDFFFFGGG